jgi:hypothetical protein
MAEVVFGKEKGTHPWFAVGLNLIVSLGAQE